MASELNKPNGISILQPEDLAEKILSDLQQKGGVSYLTDKSDPDSIYKAFNVSKGNYKNALSLLYKQRKILIEKDKITLV